MTRELMGTYDCSSVGDLIESLSAFPEDATVEVDLDYYGCYYESDTPSAKVTVSWYAFDEAKYKAKMAEYATKLASYEKWLSENSEQIEKELALRAEEERQKALREAARLEKKAEKLRRQNENTKSSKS